MTKTSFATDITVKNLILGAVQSRNRETLALIDSAECFKLRQADVDSGQRLAVVTKHALGLISRLTKALQDRSPKLPVLFITY